MDNNSGGHPLQRFGGWHPIHGGVLAAVMFGGRMFVVFTVLTLFRFIVVTAALCGLSGVPSDARWAGTGRTPGGTVVRRPFETDDPRGS